MLESTWNETWLKAHHIRNISSTVSFIGKRPSPVWTQGIPRNPSPLPPRVRPWFLFALLNTTLLLDTKSLLYQKILSNRSIKFSCCFCRAGNWTRASCKLGKCSTAELQHSLERLHIIPVQEVHSWGVHSGGGWRCGNVAKRHQTWKYSVGTPRKTTITLSFYQESKGESYLSLWHMDRFSFIVLYTIFWAVSWCPALR